ncbi:hypothetical protein ACU8KH_01345 [Lachancea thermotolerans]
MASTTAGLSNSSPKVWNADSHRRLFLLVHVGRLRPTLARARDTCAVVALHRFGLTIRKTPFLIPGQATNITGSSDILLACELEHAARASV